MVFWIILDVLFVSVVCTYVYVCTVEPLYPMMMGPSPDYKSRIKQVPLPICRCIPLLAVAYIRTYLHIYIRTYVCIKDRARKALSKKDSPKVFGTRVKYKTGTGLGGQKARQA